MCERHNLHLCVVRFPPLNISGCAVANVTAEIAFDVKMRDFLLTVDPPILPARISGEWYDNNPSFLTLELPRIVDGGMYQVALSGRTDNESHALIWKQIVSALKSRLKFGVTVINPDSQATAYAKTFGYTSGALELERSGVIMRPVAGGNLIRLEVV